MNESKTNTGKLCIKPFEDRLDTKEFVRSSEGDPELILHVPFSEQVSVYVFEFHSGNFSRHMQGGTETRDAADKKRCSSSRSP